MNSLCKPVMQNLLCTNNVIHKGNYGKTMRSVVFTDPKVPGANYIWITTAGQEFMEGQFYDITAEYDVRGILKRVRIIKDHSKTASEQDEPESKPDARDVLLGKADYKRQ